MKLKLVEGMDGWSIQKVDGWTDIPRGELLWLRKSRYDAADVTAIFEVLEESFLSGYEDGVNSVSQDYDKNDLDDSYEDGYTHGYADGKAGRDSVYK